MACYDSPNALTRSAKFDKVRSFYKNIQQMASLTNSIFSLSNQIVVYILKPIKIRVLFYIEKEPNFEHHEIVDVLKTKFEKRNIV